MDHLLERMVDHLQENFAWDRAIQRYSVPMLRIHVATGLNSFIVLMLLDGLLRVAFQIESQRTLIDIREQDDFPKTRNTKTSSSKGTLL